MKIRLILFFFLANFIVTASAQQPDTKVTLGIKPDYWHTAKGKGVKLKGVVNGGVAEDMGLKADDIIMVMNGKKIRDIFVYRDLLSTYSKNDSVVVTVVRNSKQLIFRSRFK